MHSSDGAEIHYDPFDCGSHFKQRSMKMIDKELFNEGIKTVESELSDVKRQQQHWNKGHKVNTRKLYLSLNATILTLKFLTNEAKKEFLKETQKEHKNER
jgi:hypothetical protein